MCECNKLVQCSGCQAKFDAWVAEAKLLKEEMLNGTKKGTIVSQGERNAFIAAAFTVLDLIDKKVA